MRAVLRAAIAASMLLVPLALAACGRTVQIHGTADEAWSRTLEALRAQGVLPSEFPEAVVRPRADRAEGEIDIPYASSVYYGDGAAFLQLDVDHPERRFDRTLRMWVDYPVGNNVVRYGRSIDEDESDRFFREFQRALRSLPPLDPPAEDKPAHRD